VETRKQPHTAPYHWAAALYEAGMLVSPGTPDAVDPLRQPSIVCVDTNDEATAESIENIIRGAMLPVAMGGFNAIEVHAPAAARTVLAALRADGGDGDA